MKNRNILVIKDSFSKYKDAYETKIVPYLDFFGFPYTEAGMDADYENCAVILAEASAISDKMVEKAVRGGTGLIAFCFAETGVPSSEICVEREHTITARHPLGEVRELYAPMAADTTVTLADGEVLLRIGKNALLETASLGEGKIALWHSTAWMSHRVLGPIHGMDDILWRSIVWAAKKPFVMQGMPPMIGMRIDDVWGSWREMSPENPLQWVEIAQSFGLKPWLGVFIDNIDDISTRKVREYVEAGKASAFPHGFCGCEWTGSEMEQHWIYLNHDEGPYSDEEMRENATRTKMWFDEKRIPIAKYAVPHYYEVGKNALPYLKDWGCEFIAIHMKPDTPYGSDADWLAAGPYRKYEKDSLRARRPVYYADYLDNGHFFNCVTEIRDVCGYEWAPTLVVKSTIKNGIEQVRRALDSMCPAVLFTHESAWVQRMTPKTWERALDGVLTAVSDYQPELLTMDEICRYARAKHDVYLESAESKNGKLYLQLAGQNDMETKCYVFFENEDGEIVETLTRIPQVDGKTCIEIRV